MEGHPVDLCGTRNILGSTSYLVADKSCGSGNCSCFADGQVAGDGGRNSGSFESGWSVFAFGSDVAKDATTIRDRRCKMPDSFDNAEIF